MSKRRAKQPEPPPDPAIPHAEQTPATDFQVSFSEEADGDLAAISDAGTREVIIRRALELNHEPLSQGKPLRDDLKTYRSIRAAGQRYRVVYQVAVSEGAVTVVVIGIRREGHKSDVYKRASKRLG